MGGACGSMNAAGDNAAAESDVKKARRGSLTDQMQSNRTRKESVTKDSERVIGKRPSDVALPEVEK